MVLMGVFMLSNQIDLCRKAFFEYVEEKLHYAENMQDCLFIKENMLLKLHHSMRVCGIAKRISNHQAFTDNEKNIAYLCALFHDIGRFDQFLKFKTFLDSKSVNHAECGYEILSKSDVLEEVDAETRKIVINSTRLHNLQNVPDEIDPYVRRFVNITRDADKIDILELFCNYHLSRAERRNDALELDLPDTSGFNTEIIDLIYQKKTISNSLRKNYNDMKLIHLAWVFDLNFSESFRTIKRRRTIERFSEFLPKEGEIAEVISFVNEYVRQKSE